MVTDTRLAYIDQGSFLGLRALGHQPYFQGLWLFDRPIDLAGLEAFNDHLGHTLLGRLIDTSPVPFGRHKWVGIDEVPEIHLESQARDRAQVYNWLDEMVERLSLDPEFGPGWRIAVLPLLDGGSAVTLLAPHALGDGLCKLEAIADAAIGARRGPRYPSRTTGDRYRRFWADLWLTVKDLPEVGKALLGLTAALRGANSSEASPSGRGALPSFSADARIHSVGMFVASEEWDAAAAAHGGTSNTLMQAVAVKVADALDRRGLDGLVRLAIPVSVRTPDDTRANALDSVTVACNPTEIARDIAVLRTATKAALARLQKASHAMLAVLPLTPFLPKAVVRKSEAMAMGANDVPVGCSNYGSMNPNIARIDGRDADAFIARVVEPGMNPDDYVRIGGSLYLLSGRILGRVFVSVNAFVADDSPDSARVAGALADALASFGLRETTRVF